MTTFISYLPGARGKFLAEICDLSITQSPTDSSVHPVGGAISWYDAIINDLESNGIDNPSLHGIFPEDENYKKYIKIVVDSLNKNNIVNAMIDSHYVKKHSLEYMLELGAKVVRIVVTNSAQGERMQNDFFYKNFISKTIDQNLNQEKALAMAKHLVETSDYCLKDSESKLLKSQFSQQSLNQWSMESLVLLYKCVKPMCDKILPTNIITHDRLLEINYDDVTKFETIEKVISFVGGTVNTNVVKRFNNYIDQQNKIPKFDVYIKEFVKC